MLDCFHHAEVRALSLLPQTLTLDVDLPSLHIMLLPKLPYMDLQNAFPTMMEFHIASSLTKEHILWPRKRVDGLMLMEFTGVTIFLTTQKWLD